jgi:hypothetical protein
VATGSGEGIILSRMEDYNVILKPILMQIFFCSLFSL